MVCPKCGTDNLGGKILCYKCGAKLIGAQKPLPRAAKKVKKKLRRRLSMPFITVFLILVSLTGLTYLVLKKPQLPTVKTSEEASYRLERKLFEMNVRRRQGKSFKMEMTEEEINSYLANALTTEGLLDLEAYCRKDVDLEAVIVKLSDDKLQGFISVFLDRIRKRIHLSVDGRLESKDGKSHLRLDQLKVGSLPVPDRFITKVLNMVREGEKPLEVKIPTDIMSIRIEAGNLVVEMVPQMEARKAKEPKEEKAQPERIKEPEKEIPAPEVEAEPAPEKKALSEEELEELRRKREENEANSWFQMGDNFANAGMYDSAIEYYQKVINKYPQMEQAKKARQRIEEVKSKLQSEQ